MLRRSGHPTDKIEYIIKGGTWNAYPLKYQYWFIYQSFKACNDLTRRTKNERLKNYKIKKLNKNNNLSIFQSSNLEDIQKALEIEQRYNDYYARHKIIGLTLETRPDAVNKTTIMHMRNQGCTRIELGLQAPDDKILKLVKRGHSVGQFRDAMTLLRNAGFKVDLHFMPDLPGTTAKHDVKMYESLFTDEGFKPDMVKIYPCTVIKSTPLYKWHKSGKYKPYSEKNLFDALIKMKSATPRYCRISRLIRDIPTGDIEAGNAITNLREYLSVEMEKQNLKCKCLRCREVGHIMKTLEQKNIKTLTPKLFVDEYKTTGGTEYFLSFEDSKRQVVFAFLRLRLLDDKSLTYIRELHTYGQLLDLGTKNKKASQHKGLGKKLVQEAEKISKKNKYKKISVISGVGVRGYYRKMGYRKDGTYMTKGI